MRKRATAGLLVAGLITSLAGLPAQAVGTDQPIEIPGSFRTADGVPYSFVRWVARSVDGTITDSGMTNASGEFSLLASPRSETQVVFQGLGAGRVPGPPHSESPVSFEQATYTALVCRPNEWGGVVGGWMTIAPGQSRFDVVTQAAVNSTVLVTDKYGELIRNATVAPHSYAGQTYTDAFALGWSTHNYSACSEPNQRFAGTSGFEPGVQVGGWIPGRTGGVTGSNGRALISTPGPLAPGSDFAVVRAELRPGATQQTMVNASHLTGNDPRNRVAVAVLPYAPIMEDASIASATPGEAAARMRSMSTRSAPEVVVRQPNGTVVPNTQVKLVSVLAGDTPESPVEGAVVATAVTGADGKATFTGIPTGDYRAIPVNVSARTVDFTVVAVTPPTTVVPPTTVTPPTAVTPPTTVTPTAKVTLSSVNRGSKLKVDVNPNKGNGYWTFQVQRQLPSGKWKALKSYKTQGSRETRTINLPKGTYRVVVRAKYGYAGTTSGSAYLKR